MKRFVMMAALVVAPAAFGLEAVGQFGESSRNFMLEAKLGPYTPLIDRVFTNTQGPYQRVFGGPMLLGELELDFQMLQKYGSLSLGVSAGYAEKFGRALDPVTGDKTDAPTGLRIAPLKAILTYRFDMASLKWGVPLVPYVKGALVMVPWWAVNGAAVEVADGLSGSGAKYGFGGVVGLSFTLDYLDQRLSRDFDNSMGVNHTYLFAEFALQEVTNFGTTPGGLDFSSRHWLFGLAFEF